MRKMILLSMFVARLGFAQAPANPYANPASWLCRPDRIGQDNPCIADQTATVIKSDGAEKLQTWAADPNAPIDCFYVYPTVSMQHSPNSDMTPTYSERAVVVQQIARFASKCKIYAPMYRQVTVTALRSAVAGVDSGADRALAYNDVRDAWSYYLAHDNHGRGVVLIGHSQGSKVLIELIKGEIDGRPVQTQLVSAILAGVSLQVPVGKEVGGDFDAVPLCRSRKQTGCAVAWESFRATSPPPEGARFGQGKSPAYRAACVNPAAPEVGGKGELKAYLKSNAGMVPRRGVPAFAWVKNGTTIATPFVMLPGLLTGECVSNEHGTYLAVTVNANPKDPRTDDIHGDLFVSGVLQPGWGLHLIDMHLVMGNLLELVDAQSKAWRAAHRK